jgi:hypothetical protein
MSDKRRSGKTEPFVMLPRDLIKSDAWRKQNLMCRRLIDFLMLEQMAHGGTKNGDLLATYEQLEEFGLRDNSIAGAIREAEQRGLVSCRHGTRNIPSRFTLTWLPHRDGTPASNRWREYRAPPPAKRPRRSPPKMPGKQPPKMPGKTAFFTPQNAGQTPQNSTPQNAGSSIEGLTRQAGVGKRGVEESSAGAGEDGDGGTLSPEAVAAACAWLDSFEWVHPSWVTGEGFKPALCGVKPPPAEQAASLGKPPGTVPDAWLRDEFFSLRARARDQA